MLDVVISGGTIVDGTGRGRVRSDVGVRQARIALVSQASEDDLAGMERLLRESLDAGAFGFTSSWAISHNDANGDPVPSRHATADELVHLSGVVRDYEGTNLEFITTVGRFDESHYQLMTDMSVAA